MIELSRFVIIFFLVCLNYIFLFTGIWSWTPDLFIIFVMFLSVQKKHLPNTYLFITYGFVIDLFFSNQTLPYILSFFLIGAYLNLSNIKWTQRSLLEQLIMIILVSLFLNILLIFTNDYYLDIQSRLIFNPLLNALIWILIFMTQRHKWLKNI